MATVKLPIKDPGEKLKAITDLAQHDGRFFVGATLSERKEVTQVEAITHVLGNQDPEFLEAKRTIYLTDKPRPKPMSRADRWSQACGWANDGINALIDLQGEFEDWKGNIEGKFEGTALKEKLETVCDLDLSSAQSTIEEAEGVELPAGFGRD